LRRELAIASRVLSKEAGETVRIVVKKSLSCTCDGNRRGRSYEQHSEVLLMREKQVVCVLCHLHSERQKVFPFHFIYAGTGFFGWRVPGTGLCCSWTGAEKAEDLPKALHLILSDFEVGKILKRLWRARERDCRG
jgi:hypothetical protein